MGTRGAIAHVDRDDVVTRHSPTAVEMAPNLRSRPKVPRSLGTAGRKAWRTYWASPVAAAVGDIDFPVLARLCETYDRLSADDLETKDFVALSKVASQLEVSLGVTPGARARLGIKLHEAKKATLSSVREGLG